MHSSKKLGIAVGVRRLGLGSCMLLLLMGISSANWCAQLAAGCWQEFACPSGLLFGLTLKALRTQILNGFAKRPTSYGSASTPSYLVQIWQLMTAMTPRACLLRCA